MVVVADKKEGELEQLESMKIKLMHPAGHETRPYIYQLMYPTYSLMPYYSELFFFLLLTPPVLLFFGSSQKSIVGDPVDH